MAQHALVSADYGIDAPPVIRNLSLAGAANILAYIILTVTDILRFDGFLFIAFLCFAEAVYMIWSSKVGKLRRREHIVDLLSLSGSETVLDVGCGRGLLLNAVAKRLENEGNSVGLDLWQESDLSGNTAEKTLDNARLEGVAERVEIHTGDMRQMPFEAETFDVVVSSMAIHNIPDAEGRKQAIAEIVRVLKPGGKVLVQDFRSTDEYEQSLGECGMERIYRSGLSFLIFPPVRVVVAQKPIVESKFEKLSTFSTLL